MIGGDVPARDGRRRASAIPSGSEATSSRRRLRTGALVGLLTLSIGLSFAVSSAAAAAPATLTVKPASGNTTAGTQYCVMGIVRDASGNPVSGVRVPFTVSGANTASGDRTTSTYGRALFCYTGTKAGTDTISAFADTDLDGLEDAGEPSGTATNTYTAAAPKTVTLRPAAGEDLVGLRHCVTATLHDTFQNVVPGISVRFHVEGANLPSGGRTTNAYGRATFCYTGTKTGSDTIRAFADTDGDLLKDPGEPNGAATMTWLPAPSANIAGQESIVFDWSQDKCEQLDIPDMPARAFRDALGRVQLIASHYVTRRMIGLTLNVLTHDCGVVMSSSYDPDPANFNNHEWLVAPYTRDGQTVFGLVHNEYRGHLYPGCPSGSYRTCRYDSLTSAVSHNAGDSYEQASAPAHLVASIPYGYTGTSGPIGITAPSNIVKRANGYYYALVGAEAYRAQKRGACLIRTKSLGTPTSWRAWNGVGFQVQFVDPYRDVFDDPRAHVCRPVAYSQIEKMWQSLSFNTYLGKYVLVGTSAKADSTGKVVYGIYFSYSNDLVRWSPRKLIKETELTMTYSCGDQDPIGYPSLLDPATQSRNFERTGQRAYLYFTRFHYYSCRLGLDRDLVRVPIEFQK